MLQNLPKHKILLWCLFFHLIYIIGLETCFTWEETDPSIKSSCPLYYSNSSVKNHSFQHMSACAYRKLWKNIQPTFTVVTSREACGMGNRSQWNLNGDFYCLCILYSLNFFHNEYIINNLKIKTNEVPWIGEWVSKLIKHHL